MDIRELSRAIASQVESICGELLGGGRREGHEWVYDPGSGKIKVVLDGDKRGKWSHFGGDGQGDLLDLFVKIRGGGIGEALDWARARLGIEKPEFLGSKERSYKRPERPAQAKPPERTGEGETVDWYLRQERGLSPETVKAFRVAEAPFWEGEARNDDGSPKRWMGPWIVFPYFRRGEGGQLDLINIKWLHLKRKPDPKTGKLKKVSLQATGAEPGLFGWQAVSHTARRLIVTEGEIDAMTVWQWLRAIGLLEEIAVLSVPAGAGRGEKQQWIEHEWDRLDRFEDIVLCLDQDKEGADKKTLQEIASRLGVHRVRVLILPHKDANEAHVKHGMDGAAFLECYNAARALDPEELKSAAAFVDDVIDEFYPPDGEPPGWKLPWRRASFIRIRLGEFSTFTGINGHGKSAILSQAALHICDQGAQACIFSGEMPPRQLLTLATKQAARARKPSKEHIRAIHDWYDGRLWIVNKAGQMTADRLLEIMLYARRRFGCSFFVIDSLMKCGIAEDDYNGQKAFVDRLVNFADAERVHVVLVAHSRKGKDESQPPGKLDVLGAGAITNLAHNSFIAWRNKPKETAMDDLNQDEATPSPKKEEKRADLYQKPDAMLIVDKQRIGGEEGRVHLWHDKDSASFSDKRDAIPPTFRSVPIENPADRQDSSLL